MLFLLFRIAKKFLDISFEWFRMKLSREAHGAFQSKWAKGRREETQIAEAFGPELRELPKDKPEPQAEKAPGSFSGHFF